MADINTVTLSGRVIGDVQYALSKMNKPWARFRVRSVRKVKETEEENIINCVAFGGLADRARDTAGADWVMSGRLRGEAREHNGKEYCNVNFVVDELKAYEAGAGAVPAKSESANDEPPF